MNFTMILVVFMCFVAYGSCAQPTVENGTINWHDDFETDSSEGTDLETEYDAKGLQPYYDFVNSFIATVLSKEPYDLVLKIKKEGKLPSMDYIKDEVILGFALGLVIVVAIGFLFCLIMPIVGLCFCCCRLCGNCGGEMSQQESPNNNCKRAVFAVILFMISLLMFTGVLLTFVCNDRMSDTVNTFTPSTNKMVDEAISFINRTIGEAEKLLLVDFPFVVERLREDISDNGIKTHVGDPLLEKLDTELKGPIDAVSKLSKETTRMRDQLTRIQNNSGKLNASTVELENGLREVRQNLSDIQTECNSTFSGQSVCDIDTSDLRTDADFTHLPDVSSELNKIKDIVNNDFEKSAEEGLNEVKNIPETFLNKTRQQRADIATMISDASDRVMELRKELRTKADDDVISKLQDFQVNFLPDAEEPAKKYDEYRWIAGVCLTCILLLIVVLLFLGLMCGVCGYDKEATPTTRGSVSNMGGISLMAATGFCFIFSWLLMLLATICFILGAPAQTVCKSVQTGEIFKEILDNEEFWDGKPYILSEAIFNKTDIPLTIGGLIGDCRENKPLYQAAKIGLAFDVEKKFDIKELLGNDTTKQFDDLNVNLKDQDVLTTQARANLENLRDSGVDEINFDSFLNETNKAITAVDLKAFADNVTELAHRLQEIGDNSSVRADDRTEAYRLGNRTERVAEDLRRLDNEVVASMTTESADLDTNVKGLRSIGGNIRVLANVTLKEAEKAQDFLHNQTSSQISETVTAYTNRVLGWGYQFRDHFEDVLENELARCKPLTNIFDAVVVLICNTALYPFNGFWFSIGWCLFFFIPAIIFSVKLAKHYRRMQYESDFDEGMYPESFEMRDRPPPAYPTHDKKQWANPNGYSQGSRY